MDDLYEKKLNDPRIQAHYKQSGHNILSVFIISRDYYELPERTIRGNGNIHHIFKPNNFRDVQNLFQDKASKDMTLIEFNLLTCACWK